MSRLLKVEIYTKDDCMWCIRAKNFLEFNNLPYLEYKVTPKNIDGIKETFPEASTVPIILIDGLWIGGYQDLVQKAYEEEWLLS